MSHFRKGKIKEIGTDDNAGMYTVTIPDENIVTGWLTQLRMFQLEDQQDWVYAQGELVCVGFYDEEMRDGFIIGAPNSAKQKPKTTDANLIRTTYKDDSYIEYDKSAHKYTLYVKSGDINITSDSENVNINCDKATITATTEAKIDSKLTVTKDVVIQGKLDVTGDISGSAKVKAATGMESQADVTAGGGAIALLTHKHTSAAPGSPTSPPIP